MHARPRAVIAVLLFLSLAGWSISPKVCGGKPNFASGESKGYYVWRDSDAWHIRWATKGQRRVFSGTLASDAPFESCEGRDQGPEDAVALATHETIRFESRSSGGVKGIDFRPGVHARFISFDLQLDGAPAPAELVRLGFRGTRPPAVPFRVETQGD